jgi:transglutaminase-like putative cysteine protease
MMISMESDVFQYTQPTITIDCNHVSVREFARSKAGNSRDHKDQAVDLYYAVRDGIRYDPYTLSVDPGRLRASRTLETRRGWCVAKAILLAASCRALGIPARLGFADVRNHLSTANMRKAMKTDIFFWHGYTSIFLHGQWVKATPAFNIELCERFRLKPLDFDGQGDSLFQPFDLDGHKHMEYLRYLGEYADVPIERMGTTFQKEYGIGRSWDGGDFDHEVTLETEKG